MITRRPRPALRGQQFWHVVFAILAGQCLLSALSEVGQGKTPQRDVWNGVAATSSFHSQDDHLRRRGHHAAMAAALEARLGSDAGLQHQHVYFAQNTAATANLTVDNDGRQSANSSDVGVSSALSSATSETLASTSTRAASASPTRLSHNESAQSLSMVDSTESKNRSVASRWGQSVAHLPNSTVMIFTGGRVSDEAGTESITNDVLALELSSAKTSQDKSSNGYTWTRLTADGAPSHAFSAQAIPPIPDKRAEFFIIGGSTSNCSSNATVYRWRSGVDDDWRSGQWSILNGNATISENATLPPRRRGAMAVQVPGHLGLGSGKSPSIRNSNETSPSFMVFGGEMDAFTCNGTNSTAVSAYPRVDIWTANTTMSSSARAENKSHNATRLDVRSMPLDLRMPNMSIVDYSAVVLPANTTSGLGMRVLFIGGRNANGAMTPMASLWALDLETSGWIQMSTRNASDKGDDLPASRVGHTSTILEDGSILVHGGFTTLNENQTASAETYLLDVKKEPPTWQRLTIKSGQNHTEAGNATARAFHSASLVDGVLVVAFGQHSLEHQHAMAFANSSDLAKRSDHSTASNASHLLDSARVRFLDTRRNGTWEWMSNYTLLLEERLASSKNTSSPDSTSSQLSGSSATASSVASSSAARDPHATKAASNTPQSVGKSSTSKHTTKAADHNGKEHSAGEDSAPSETSLPTLSPTANGDQSPATSSQAPGSDQDSSSGTKTTTTVIASVLGAAGAIAILVVGYAGFRRWQAKQQDADAASIDDSKYERFVAGSATAVPPVSALWFNQPLSSQSDGGRGTKRRNDEDGFDTTPDGRRQLSRMKSVTLFSGPRRRDSPEDRTYSGSGPMSGSANILQRSSSAHRLAARQSEKQRRLFERRQLAELGEEGDDTFNSEGWVDYLNEDGIDSSQGQIHPRTFMSRNRTDAPEVLGDQSAAHSFGRDGRDSAETLRPAYEDDDVDTLNARRRPSAVTLSQMSPSDAASHLSYPYLQATHWHRDGHVEDEDDIGLYQADPRASGGEQALDFSKYYADGYAKHLGPMGDVTEQNPFAESQSAAVDQIGGQEESSLPWAMPDRNKVSQTGERRSTTLLATKQKRSMNAGTKSLLRQSSPPADVRLRRERPSLLRVTNASATSLDRPNSW